MTDRPALPPDWTPDGDGFKGPCPLCRGGGRRAWVRPYSGRWRAGCDSCDAKSAALVDALGLAGGDVPAAAPVPAVRPVLDADAATWAAALPAVERGAGRLRLDRRGLRPAGDDLRWASLERLDGSPWASWIFPTRRADQIIGGGLTSAARGFNRELLTGCLVWLWRLPARGGALELCGLELEGVTDDGGRLDFVTGAPDPVKRISVPGGRPTAGAFIAARPTVDRLHVCEGGPDALMLAAVVPSGEGVVAAHGAGALRRMWLWCRGRDVTVWAHLDPDGAAGAVKLAGAVLEAGRPVEIQIPPAGANDWVIAGEGAILEALERGAIRDE